MCSLKIPPQVTEVTEKNNVILLSAERAKSKIHSSPVGSLAQTDAQLYNAGNFAFENAAQLLSGFTSPPTQRRGKMNFFSAFSAPLAKHT